MKRGQEGFSLMELIVVIGLVGLMLTIAAPAANSKAMSLPQEAEELQSNFRLARANSMRHGAHFRVTITGAKTYTIQRMQDADGDGIWAVDSLGSGQVFLTVLGSDCHKRCQAQHPQRGGGHPHDNRCGRI